MKRVILPLICLVLFSSAGFGQFKRTEMIKKSTQPSAPVPPLVYTLTSARVTINTGSDNKEFPSYVATWLISKGKGFLFYQPGMNMRNEMKVNSSTEYGLLKWPTGTINPAASLLLSDIQSAPITLRVMYYPNIFTDAWRIEGISVTLEFRDQNGNLHPTLGSKTIVFNNTSGFLNAWEQVFECVADGSFTPITSSIMKDASGYN